MPEAPKTLASSLSSTLGQLRDAVLDCPSHGPQQVKDLGLSNGEWLKGRCPVCIAEKERAEAERQAERNRQEAERLRRHTIERKLTNAAIPPRFAGKTFADFHADTPADGKVLAVCQDYVDRFGENFREGRCLVLFGQVGTGKTHLACAMLNDVVMRYQSSVRYLTMLKAIRTVKDTYDKAATQTEEQAIAALVKPDLLVLDEVGVQHGSETERMIAFEIINARYEAMKPTVLITNLDLAGLTECLGDRALDRLKENGGKLVMFTGNSKRGAA